MDNGHDADGWLPLTEAAPVLGVHVDTLRRRIRQGQIQARQVPTKFGPAYQVRLGVEPSPGPTLRPEPVDPSPTPVQPLEPVALEALRLVEKLTQQNLELSGRCGYLQAELATAREQLALMAPREGVTSNDTTTPAPSNVLPGDVSKLADQTLVPRGPWGRFLAWLYG